MELGPMVFGNFGRMLHKLAEQNLIDKAQCLSRMFRENSYMLQVIDLVLKTLNSKNTNP